MKLGIEKRIAQLRVGLAFASRTHRPRIQAMIDQLLAETDDREYMSGAGMDMAAAPLQRRAGDDPDEAGNVASPAAAAGEAAPDGSVGRECATCKRRFTPEQRRQQYCGPDCQQRRPRQIVSRAPAAERAYRAERRLRLAAPASAPMAGGGEARPRQPPVPQRNFRLGWDPMVVIRPPRPAPVKRYRDGRPCEFQDDLNAIADPGSPGPLPLLPVAQARMNALA